MSTISKNRRKTLFLAQFSILLAIEAVVCFTPLGSLPAIGPVVATLSHIPVIITAVALGTGAGAGMGFAFGLFSFLVWTFTPPSPIAFVFTPFYSLGEFNGNFYSLLICFVPRILIGVVTGLLCRALKRLKQDNIKAGIAALIGSLTNTFLVLLGIYFFFGESFAAVNEVTVDFLLKGFVGMTILTSGLPEAALAAFLAAGVAVPVKKALKKYS
ncbi:MAG: ECF transporter S component [Oscillospiraceae bacterium]|nr:ECF transporter S component [Oscillospiraceae bacterium]